MMAMAYSLAQGGDAVSGKNRSNKWKLASYVGATMLVLSLFVYVGNLHKPLHEEPVSVFPHSSMSSAVRRPVISMHELDEPMDGEDEGGDYKKHPHKAPKDDKKSKKEKGSKEDKKKKSPKGGSKKDKKAPKEKGSKKMDKHSKKMDKKKSKKGEAPPPPESGDRSDFGTTSFLPPIKNIIGGGEPDIVVEPIE